MLLLASKADFPQLSLKQGIIKTSHFNHILLDYMLIR